MELKLYHYVHCPFCVRVRMTLGFLQLPYQSIVLPYDDEVTPVNLTGLKMLPIVDMAGQIQNESLVIMAKLDWEHKLQIPEHPLSDKFNELLNKLGTNVHNLAMPHWIYTPEFNEPSREYFLKKKEAKRGPFKELISRRGEFESVLMLDLESLSSDLIPFYKSQLFTVYDILLASHLWGLYVVPEFQFPIEVHKYLQKIKMICHFDYQIDFRS